MSDHIEVQTTAGRVRGLWRDTTGSGQYARSAAFLGIPFAEAPVGDLRFAEPLPKAPWEGVRDAFDHGPTAQRGDPGVVLIPEPSIPGESTLNVNVFTPSPTAPSDGDGLPVLVWIHGGGYFAGSPASPWYDGRNFNRDGVVTVTLSYRLGFDGFGWMEGAPLNRAVLDWLLALRWVRRNIAAFGGDPKRVTIAGQSAGGGAVLTLLGMEKAQGLFQKAIVLSGATADVKLATAVTFAQDLAEKLGVPASREGFSSLTEEQILAVQKESTKMDAESIQYIIAEGLPLGPIVDGELIKRPTRHSLRAGVGVDKPLMIGATDDEFTMAFVPMEKLFRWIPRSMLLKKLGISNSVQKRYVRDNADVASISKMRLAGRLLTDQMFRALIPKILADRGVAPSWAYRFSWPSGEWGFAEHCLDVPFFFDCLDGPQMEPLAGPTPPQALADEVHSRAVRFITDGDPGWPKHESPSNIVRVYNAESHDLEDGYRSVAALL